MAGAAAIAVRSKNVRRSVHFVKESPHCIETKLHIVGIEFTCCEDNLGVDDGAIEEFASEFPRALANLRANTTTGEIICRRTIRELSAQVRIQSEGPIDSAPGQ